MAESLFVEADIWTVAQTDQGNAVLLRPRGTELVVPLFIGQLEVQSILIGISKVDIPRPLTHDLIVALAAELEVDILRIEITELREGTFFARLVLGGQEREISMDVRPSDAIGVAVRVACPIFIAQSLIDEAGVSMHLVKAMPLAGDNARLRDDALLERDKLLRQLEKAIDIEDYESAAVLRDKLKSLEAGG